MKNVDINNFKDTIDKILSKSPNTPIIIIQGDHGFWFLSGEKGKKKSHTILNAYLLPGGGGEKLYPSITPVNSFRLLFYEYFGTRYKLIEPVAIINFIGKPAEKNEVNSGAFSNAVQ